MGYWKAGCPRDVDVALVRIGAVNAPGYQATLAHVRNCQWCQRRIDDGTVRATPKTAASASKVGMGIALGIIVFIVALWAVL